MNNLREIDTVAHPMNMQVEPVEEAAPNPLLLAHGLFRGRYWIIVPLALLAAVPAAWLGYHAMPPVYEAGGVIRVHSKLPKLIYDVDENQPLSDSYVATQADLIKVPRVLERAAQNENLLAAGWPAPPEGVALLQGKLRISNPRNTENIHVTIEDESPERAYRAIQAVMEAVENIYISDERLELGRRQEELEKYLQDLREQQRIAQANLNTARGAYYIEEIQPLLRRMTEVKFTLERSLQQKIQQRELLLAHGAQTSQEPQVEASPVTPEQLAALDPVLESLLTDRNKIQIDIGLKSGEYGEKHEHMIALRRQLSAIQQQIDQRVEMLRQQPNNPAIGLALGANNLEQLNRLIELDEKEVARIEGEIREINQTNQAVELSRAALADVNSRIGIAEDRLQKLLAERQGREQELSRIEIVSNGSRPLTPSRDRRVPLAGAASVAAAGAVVGLFGLAGLMKREYRYVEDVSANNLDAPFLGTIPALSFENRQVDEMAALCVHHVRNLLQLQTPKSQTGGATVYTVTSSASGDGKTSLTFALGMSFAAAGYETVLVDADLIGEGLTHQMQMTGRRGLKEAVQAGHVNGELTASGLANLYVLPVGASDLRPEELSQRSVHGIVNELRRTAEIILIDTGPMPGCLEADLVATVSDAVVLTVSRGSRAAMVRAALKRLRTLRAPCAGIVFNRASRVDCERSTSISASARSVRALPAASGNGQRDAVVRALLRDHLEDPGQRG